MTAYLGPKYFIRDILRDLTHSSRPDSPCLQKGTLCYSSN